MDEILRILTENPTVWIDPRGVVRFEEFSSEVDVIKVSSKDRFSRRVQQFWVELATFGHRAKRGHLVLRFCSMKLDLRLRSASRDLAR